jgi:hypothetical protein
MSMVEDINQKRMEQARIEQEEVRKEKERADNLKLIQAVTQGQQGGGLLEAMMAMGKLRGLPQTGQQFNPDQQTGTAVDYETGNAYTPQQTQPRSEAYNSFLQKYALSKQPQQIDISQYPNASPATALAAMTHQQTNDPRMKILEMVEKAQEKGDTRDWEKEKLGLQHQGAMELERVKNGNKVPDSEYKLQIAYEQETDPVKKAQMKATLDRIHNERIRIARESRTPPVGKTPDEQEGQKLLNEERRRKLNQEIPMNKVDAFKHRKAQAVVDKLEAVRLDPMKWPLIEGDKKMMADYQNQMNQAQGMVKGIEDKYLGAEKQTTPQNGGVPKGAVLDPTKKTKSGGAVYKLPDGRLWTP